MALDRQGLLLLADKLGVLTPGLEKADEQALRQLVRRQELST